MYNLVTLRQQEQDGNHDNIKRRSVTETHRIVKEMFVVTK